jgi:hypothetical protein
MARQKQPHQLEIIFLDRESKMKRASLGINQGLQLKMKVVLYFLSLMAVLSFSQNSQACRNCPFPLKVGDNTWMMPNGKVQIDIQKTTVSIRNIEIGVLLTNVATGQVMAIGYQVVRRGTRQYRVDLTDMEGRAIHAEFEWLDFAKGTVSIELSCDNCRDSSLLK